MRIALLFIALTLTSLLWGQTGTLRGNILDKETGEPIIYGTVLIEGTTVGTHTDLDGFFALSELEPGSYAIVATYIGYDTA